MLVDQIMAQLRDAGIDLNAAIAMPTDRWAMACLIGKTVSLLHYGYEDWFDGMDWEDAACDVLTAIEDGEDVKTRADIIRFLKDCGYDLEDYS